MAALIVGFIGKHSMKNAFIYIGRLLRCRSNWKILGGLCEAQE